MLLTGRCEEEPEDAAEVEVADPDPLAFKGDDDDDDDAGAVGCEDVGFGMLEDPAGEPPPGDRSQVGT
jgi:hypothetical protein